MGHNRPMRGAAYCIALAVTLGATGIAAAQTATGASGWANPLKKRYVQGEELNVCDQGAFFVGGVPKVTNYASSATTVGPPEQLIIGQMYVQFMIPSVRHQWPLVMVHGSGYTGSALDATPDGRQGWFSYAVQHKLATFVVDQPGRGRSGFDRSVFHEARVSGNVTLIPTLGGGSSNNIWTSWFGHILPAGSNIVTGVLIRHGDPGDPDPPENSAQTSEAHGNYPPAYPIPPVPNSIDPNIQARIGALGPPPNAVNDTYLSLLTYKYLVPNTEATLPGSTCATCNPTTVGPADTWSPRALADLVEGLGGAIVSPHSQSGSQVMHMVRVLKERGKLDLVKGILIPESAGTALAPAGLVGSDFDHIPFLVVNGDYRPLTTRQVNYATVAAMNASPTRAVGPAMVINEDSTIFNGEFNGTTHMNMLGTTNLKVFDLMFNWASANIPNPLVGTDCAKVKGKEKEKDKGKDKDQDTGP